MNGTSPTEMSIESERMPAAHAAATPAHGVSAEAVCVPVFWAFVAGLAWTPFWFGSNVLLAWGINAVLFPGLALILEAALLASGARHPVRWRVVALPIICVGAVIVFIVVQNATWTPRTLHHPIWEMASGALGQPAAGSISVNRDLTMQALIRLVTAASVFWLALQLCRNPLRANRLMMAVAAIVTAYAAYGLVARTLEPNASGFVSSTFYNRNHFAAYAGMGLIVAVGLLFRLYRSVPPRNASWRMRAADFLETTGKAGAFHVSIVAVIAAALMLTGSRGGIVSFLAGAAVLTFLIFGRRKGSGGEQIAVVGLLGLLVAAVFMVFGDAFFGKVEHLGFGDETRLAIYRLTVSSILNAPFLGYGYGTFADVFPMFRDRSVDIAGLWTAAHNSYLEIFQGLGLVFGTLLILAVLLPAMRCVAGAVTRKVEATMPAIAASVACLIGLNALVDFSLQVQAITLTFMAILGAGVAQATSSRIDLRD
jgi:O-antigen ligase